jgi:glyoxylase-like metal-dependent hydrolase (beta-lactamase superfamily II)
MPAATPCLPAYAEALGHGIYSIDTAYHRERFDAAFLIVQDGHAAVIDTGTNLGVPRLLATLEALGLARDAVDFVIPTHVHLDHAGGVGLLTSELPHATVLVHPRGARHLIDPSALWQGASAIYGPAEMARWYGTVVPVPADRVRTTHEGMTVELAGRPLRFADTPGHARHCHCIWDGASRGWFTGDTFGLSYREFDTSRGPWILPTATPVQFEPELLRASIERLLNSGPQLMYITHFGGLGGAGVVPRLGALLLAQLAEMVALGHALRQAPDRHQALRRGQLEMFTRGLAEHGCTLGRERIAALLEMDLELNAQGLAIWLDR